MGCLPDCARSVRGGAASMKSGEFKMRIRDNEGRRTDGRTDGRTVGLIAASVYAAPCNLLLLVVQSALDGTRSKSVESVIKKVQGRTERSSMRRRWRRGNGERPFENRESRRNQNRRQQSTLYRLPFLLLPQLVNTGRSRTGERTKERTR